VKLREEFEVAQPVGTVWEFFDEPERAGWCVPGIEQLAVVSPDEMDVRVTQSFGPLTATFAARVVISDRTPEKFIGLTVTGKSVRGAVGNVRSTVAVQLEPIGERTAVLVEGDVALAGALGSVGQKVVAKQARKLVGQFAGNLERALGGGDVQATGSDDRGRVVALPRRAASPAPDRLVAGGDPWPKVASLLSAVSVAVSVAALWQANRRTPRGWRRWL